MDNELMLKLQHFFAADGMIKKEIYAIAPPGDNGYLDRHSIAKYTDALNEVLIYTFSELKHITSDIFGIKSDVYSKVKDLEKIAKTRFYNCGFDIVKLREFYKNYISNMEPKFVDSVKNTCIGYTMNGTAPINMVGSINEVLHFVHAYVLNNERLLQAVPLIGERKNDFGYTLSLRGVQTQTFDSLYENFPNDMDCGWTDMVALNERKFMMMVRDRGHALSIEITINNDIARIEYFIPKLCNISMINALPGINKVNEHSVGATGVIEIPVDELNSTVYGFISKVPMDADMFKEDNYSK